MTHYNHSDVRKWAFERDLYEDETCTVLHPRVAAGIDRLREGVVDISGTAGDTTVSGMDRPAGSDYPVRSGKARFSFLT